MPLKPTYDELEQRIQKLEKNAHRAERLKELLWENEQTLRSTLESIKDLIFVLDKKGIFTNYFQSPDQPSLFAHPDKFLGKNFRDVMPDNVSKLVKTAISRMKASGRAQIINYAMDIKGEKKWYETTLNPRMDQDEKYDGITAVARDISERKQTEDNRQKLINKLQDALAEVRTLSGLLPICASCKKIRDDKGYWNQIEEYIHQHTDAQFSHSICPECARKLYPDYYKD